MELALPRVVVEELVRRAQSLGLSIEEYLLDILTRDMDPDTVVEKYLEGAKQLLEQAREELEKDDLRQAGEKIWGACALAIKAYVLARYGKRIESHRELWVYKNEVAKELGEWVRIVFKLADSMHRNFYEGLATKEDVEDVLREVQKLVEAVVSALTKQRR